jgi:hypothetical protein
MISSPEVTEAAYTLEATLRLSDTDCSVCTALPHCVYVAVNKNLFSPTSCAGCHPEFMEFLCDLFTV